MGSTATPRLKAGALQRPPRRLILSGIPSALRTGGLIPNPLVSAGDGPPVRLDAILAGRTAVLTARRPDAGHFGIPWPRYRLIGVAELAAAAGILIGLWWHPLGLAAAAGMTLLLLGALITHRRAADGGKEMAPALLALAITIAYLAIALTSWA